MIHIAAARAHDDDLRRLVELRRCARGQHLELCNRIQRGHLRLGALQRHFLVAHTIQRGAQGTVRIAAAGSDRHRYTARRKLVLRAGVLHSGRQCNQSHQSQASIQWRVLDGLAINDRADRRLFRLNHRRRARHLDRLLLSSHAELRVDLNHLVDREHDVRLLDALEACLLRAHRILPRRQ